MQDPPVRSRLAATMPPTSHPDDTVGPESVPTPAAPTSPRPPRPLLRVRLPADPVAPSVARTQLRRWLGTLSWPAGQLADILLAASEAVSNAAEHAYRNRTPGMIELSGAVEITPGGQRRAILTVRDHGHWRPPPADDEGRRRGIPLMRACMDTVTITHPHDQTGTRVVLRSRAVPPAS